jgi:membrane associated rhomboid family serine protease
MTNKFISLWLCGICILMFVFQLTVTGFTDHLLLTSDAWTEPWRFVTSIFLHADIPHILYNLFALALFGAILESLIGSGRFSLVFFATGIGANLVAVNFYASSLGASGAIFGVIGALIVVRPSLTVWAFGLPMPLFVAGILWAAGDFIGLFVPSTVGNIAHLSGMGIGLLFGLFYRNWSLRSVPRQKVYIREGDVRNWEETYLR